MVGERDGSRLRNAERALVWPYAAIGSTTGIEPIGQLRVYKDRKNRYAQNPDDNDMLGLVVPATEGNGYVCASAEAENRIRQKPESTES